jgi:hypothetical protein
LSDEGGRRVMRYPDVKNGKEKEDHWVALSDFERDRFERHANFLIDRGYMAVDPLTLAVSIAWKLRDSPRPEGLVYEDGSRARRAVD